MVTFFTVITIMVAAIVVALYWNSTGRHYGIVVLDRDTVIIDKRFFRRKSAASFAAAVRSLGLRVTVWETDSR